MNKLLVILLIVLTVSAAAAKDTDKVIDKTKESFKEISTAPTNIKGKISVTDSSTKNYTITVRPDRAISIKKEEKHGEHTKANLKIEKTLLNTLPGYDGKEFACADVENGTLISYQIINVKDHTSGSSVVVPVSFSEVIIGGATGIYSKTIEDVSLLNTTIYYPTNSESDLYIQLDNVPTYQVWNESNKSTYPSAANLTLLWTFNGNINDLSGNSRTGTKVSGYYTPDRNSVANGAIYLDGTNDYVYNDYSDTLFANGEMITLYKLNKSTDSIIVDYRNPTGVGRMGMYTYENQYYIDGATIKSNVSGTVNQGWKWASYPFTAGQINYVWLGVRYSLQYDWYGWFDVFGLYNKQLTANERRQLSLGFKGIKVQAEPSTAVTPITGINQSVPTEDTITGLHFWSNNDSLYDLTILNLFQENHTLVREHGNTSVRNVDIVYTPSNNLTACDLKYDMVTSDYIGIPEVTCADPYASVQLIGTNISVSTGNLTKDTPYNYNVSIYLAQHSFTSTFPSNSTLSTQTGESISLNVTVNSTADVTWAINGTTVQEDTNVSFSEYSFLKTTPGTYPVISSVVGDSTEWTITVQEDTTDYPKLNVTEWDPSNLSCNGILQIDTTENTSEWVLELKNITVGNTYSIVDTADNTTITSRQASNTTLSIFLLDIGDGTYLIRESEPTPTSSYNWVLAAVFLPFFAIAFGLLRKWK